ncbi:MAG: hypothetical protein AAGG68_10625 [Bacteroidota bacterium]
MKAQTLLLILFSVLLSYLILNIQFEQNIKKGTSPSLSALENPLLSSIDTLPKYTIEKDGIITPKGRKYHILIVPPDTTQNWKMQQMLIEKMQKFHMLMPEIE